MSIARRKVWATMAVPLLFLVSCGDDDDGAASPQSEDATTPAPDTVRIGVFPTSSFAPHFVAEGMGAFDDLEADLGTTVETTLVTSGPDGVAAIAAGELDFIILPAGNAMQLQERGQDLVAVANLNSVAGSIVIVGDSKYEEERGTDITDYDGARWGFTKAGSATDIVAQVTAREAGLAWSEQSPVALGSAFVPALTADQVDIASMDTTSAAEALREGEGYLMLMPGDPESGSPLARASLALVVRGDFEADYPDVVQRVVAAELAGLFETQRLIDDPAAVLDLFPDEYDEVFQSEGFDGEWELSSPGLRGIDGGFGVAVIDDTIEFYEATVGSELADNTLVDKSISDEYIDGAYEILGLEPPSR